MKSVRKIFAMRVLELAFNADAANYSPLVRAIRKMPGSFFRRLTEIAEQ